MMVRYLDDARVDQQGRRFRVPCRRWRKWHSPLRLAKRHFTVVSTHNKSKWAQHHIMQDIIHFAHANSFPAPVYGKLLRALGSTTSWAGWIASAMTRSIR
jgi:hypothetical protein